MAKKDPSFFDQFFSLDNLSNDFTEFFAGINLLGFARAIGYFFIGMIITLFARWVVGKMSEKQLSAHHSMLFRRITLYIGFALSLIVPFKESGIDLTALLGAAGILTVAVAFAAQTSISNFLSGVFLIAEKSFIIGDWVLVNDILGEVLSIDLLSVKLRTKDNTLVRIPNETLLKLQFRNVSRFPIRRCDVKIRIAFHEDLEKVKKILMEVADQNPLSLSTPIPEITFLEFGESAIILQLSVWAKQKSYNDLLTNIQMEAQAALNANGIELPAAYPTLATLTSLTTKSP